MTLLPLFLLLSICCLWLPLAIHATAALLVCPLTVVFVALPLAAVAALAAGCAGSAALFAVKLVTRSLAFAYEYLLLYPAKRVKHVQFP